VANQFHPSSEKSSDIPKVPRSGIKECKAALINILGGAYSLMTDLASPKAENEMDLSDK
jgi:hypothetical protein